MSPENPTIITVPTSTGTITIPVPEMVPTTDWNAILGIQAAVAAAFVAKKNAELQASYTQAVESYNTMMQSGSFPVIAGGVPVAPKSFVFLADGGYGMPSFEQSGPPVVSAVPLATVNNAHNPQANTSPNMIMIGNRNGNTKWFTAIKGDTFPNGLTTPPETSADGVTGLFEKFGAPVGPGWYLLVS